MTSPLVEVEKPVFTARHYAANGAARPEGVVLPGELFDGVVNDAVLHQAVKTYLGNQRQGTHKVKTRREVSGGGRKPWKQKGTGRARSGSNRAPHWRGGGVAFGPSPRDYRADIPKKVRRLARRSALNARAREGMLSVIDPIQFATPKTQDLLALLGKLAPSGTKILLLTTEVKPALYLSARNVAHLEVLCFAEATAYDILHAELVVVESSAFGTELHDAESPAPVASHPKLKSAKSKANAMSKAAAKPKAASKAKAAAKPKAVAKPKAAAKPKKAAAPKAKSAKKGKK